LCHLRDTIPIDTRTIAGSCTGCTIGKIAMVLVPIVTVPVPALLIPIIVWALFVLPELALMLPAVDVLPIVLLLIVVVPAVPVLFIPVILLAKVAELAAVIEPMILFSQSKVPVLAILIPYTFAPVAWAGYGY